MKTKAFFDDLKNKDNVLVLHPKDNIINQFCGEFNNYQDKFFYEQFICSGGIIIDNWIRIYGCGELNIVEKNMLYNRKKVVDILIGEDVLGGLFGLKDNVVYYFAPDTNGWEWLNIYYTQFLGWLMNNPEDVNKFYESFKWSTWREDCEAINLNEGYSFYPLLQMDMDIEQRSRRVISIDELIRFNLGE